MAYHLVRVVLADILQIAIDRGNRRVGKGGGHVGQHLGPGIDVVCMEKAHHLAGGAGNALVQGVVDAAIRLADQHGQPVPMCLQHGHRTVGTGAVDNHMLAVRIRLRRHRGQTVDHGGGAVPGCGDDGNLHCFIV